jgi:amino acid permease
VLALIACNIGGGIVGVPFAIYNYGIPLGVALIILVAVISLLSVMLLLKSKELCKQESYYEIGYIVMGRNAILLISAAIICQLFGIIVVYYIVFADTLSLLVRQAITGT